MTRLRRSSRQCAICGAIIPDSHVVCKDDWRYYQLNKSEPWMKELVNSSRRQFEIDNEELALEIGDFVQTPRAYKKLTQDEINLIHMYKEKGLGPSAISKLTAINYQTIRNYFYPYKKNP